VTVPRDTRFHVFVSIVVALLAVGGYLLFRQAIGYTYLSDWHVGDLMGAKLWTILSLIIFLTILWRARDNRRSVLAVLFVSIYFVVLYGLLFHATEYGMNGHWGDNGNRLALICKMMAYDAISVDWYLKALPSFYPPGWFILMAAYAKIIGIEAYQTIKFGYLLIFLVYPWLVYFSWKPLVSRGAAALISVGTLFIATKYLDWIYYEHITAALFMPWWLYFFEAVKRDQFPQLRRDWRFYALGSLLGAALFVTYYYWFFLIVLVTPVVIVWRYLKGATGAELRSEIRHKLLMGVGVAVLSSWWEIRLVLSILRYGSESAQNQWFGLHHADLLLPWNGFSWLAVMTVVGLILVGYIWRSTGRTPLAWFFVGALLAVGADRLYNIWESSLQSRKVLEMVHVFAMAPLGIGVVAMWRSLRDRAEIRYALVAAGLMMLLLSANSHTEIASDRKYEIAINQRVPEKELAVFDGIDVRHTVWLTTHYREACYLPYYLFIPYNNMTAHTAGRYSEREDFLKQVAAIDDAAIVAYALRRNLYDAVDYVYLPSTDDGTGFEMRLYKSGYNHKGQVEKVPFRVNFEAAPVYFKRHGSTDVFEVLLPTDGATIRGRLRHDYPRLMNHIR